MTSLFDLDCVEDALRCGTLMLTPNQRLADALRGAAAARERRAGGSALRAPRVQTLQQWCLGLWRALRWNGAEAALSRRLLGEGEEYTLWLAAIRADADALGGSLLHPEQAARSAQSAYDLLCQWQLAPESPALAAEFAASADSAAFLRWRHRFVERCRVCGWQSRAALPQLLLEAFCDGSLPRQELIALVGFIELSPLRRQLLEAAAPLRSISPAPRPQRVAPRRVACDDPEAELRCAARWARAALAADAGHSVGLVVPDLAPRRVEVRRVLLEVLDPGALLDGTDGAPLPFNISAGTALASEPLIGQALAWLRLAAQGLPAAELRRLLHAPSLALGLDASARATLSERLAQWLGAALGPAELRRLSAPDDTASAAFCERLEATRRLAPQRRGLASAWVRAWRRQLGACRWPTVTLDSREYQLSRRWDELLDELASGDEIYGELSVAGALALLTQAVSRCQFQPRGGTARLQVLGVLEADQLHFSHLWLASMDDARWPPPHSPNPLLPRSLQARLGMPRADHRRELDYACRLSASFMCAADELVVSYARRDADAQSTRPSALFGELAAMAAPMPAADAEELPGWCAAQSAAAGQTQEYATPAAAPLGGIERAFSAQALADQSDCPFRAMARHRWQAERGAMPAPSSSRLRFAGVRGQLVHAALERLWAELGTRDALLRCSEGALTALVERAVASAVAACQHERRRLGEPQSARFWQLESRRTAALLLRWLQEVESRRDEDFRVLLREDSRAFLLAGVPFRLRLDRVDAVPGETSESLLVIDYKTGRISGSLQRLWGGERPADPQLPLYALALAQEGPVRGLAYAQLRPAELRCRGAVEHWGDAPPEEADWPGQIERWRDSLGCLAAAFAAGAAPVSPRDQQSCRNCACAALCRVGEVGA